MKKCIELSSEGEVFSSKLTLITFVTSQSISAISARCTVVSRVPWYSRVSTNTAFTWGFVLCDTPDRQ